MLARHRARIAAVIVEPLVQGAAGMAMHDAAYLARARAITTRHDVHLIADEIMTGFGRTGTLFAWEQAAAAAPDLLCLSKGITGGTCRCPACSPATKSIRRSTKTTCAGASCIRIRTPATRSPAAAALAVLEFSVTTT